ncbi:charged multivesicular body protein 4b [Aethina tumida]|uniref:charged multivesicular body protein 4b n=1 Tax=Aethina tumida TaxID=116153 RepID=UPI002147AF50|nr:charged multivesicular body protein 4b [Aethina tumida]
MSFFGKIFGGKEEKKAPTTGEAIQKLRETEDMLFKKQDFLEKKIQQEIVLAKKNAAQNKRAALQALKRKKRYEKQLTQIDGTLTTIEMQREALEGANTNTAVLESMQNAADALAHAHKFMDVDKVHDMMDDIAEQQELSNEISNAISNPVGFGEDLDDDELAKELEELEQQDLDEKILDVPNPLPSVPDTPVAVKPKPTKKDVHEDDLKELEAWAS